MIIYRVKISIKIIRFLMIVIQLEVRSLILMMVKVMKPTEPYSRPRTISKMISSKTATSQMLWMNRQ